MKGAKQEESITLYVQNLVLTENDNYDTMKKKVLIHADLKGIKVITTRVIRNKHCDDLVGCQITVPLIHIDRALDDDNWPPYVTCRKWTEKTHNSKVTQWLNP